MNRFWTIFLIILFISVGAWWWSTQSGRLVDVAQVERKTIQTYLEERAKTRVPEIYRITMPLTGRIKPIKLLEGDEVTAGMLVAQMDQSDLKTDLDAGKSRVSQFDELINSFQLAIEAAQEQTTASNEKFLFESSEFKRISQLAESKSVSLSELGEAQLAQFESRVDHRTDLLNWRALESIQSALNLGKVDSEEEQNKKQRDFDRSKIISPVSGTILKRNVSNERVLQAGETLLELGQLDKIEVEAEVLTQQATQLRKGDRVEFSGPTLGNHKFTGTVFKIYPQGFTKISSLGVEEQRVLVIMHFDQTPEELKKKTGHTLGADYRLQAKIFTAEKQDAMVVPRSCLFRGRNSNWNLFVIHKGKAIQREVEVGLMNDLEAEIQNNLEEGDHVILAPETDLTPQTWVQYTQN